MDSFSRSLALVPHIFSHRCDVGSCFIGFRVGPAIALGGDIALGVARCSTTISVFTDRVVRRGAAGDGTG